MIDPIPRHLRPTLGQQRFIVRCINVLGYNPFRKPIHHYTRDELREITRMYQEVTNFGSQEVRL